jgi:hypothetical protein
MNRDGERFLIYIFSSLLIIFAMLFALSLSASASSYTTYDFEDFTLGTLEGQQNFYSPGGTNSGATIVASSCPSGSGQCIRNYKGSAQYLWVHDFNTYENDSNVVVTFTYKFSSSGLNSQFFYFLPSLSGVTDYVSAELASTCSFTLSDTSASSINSDTTGFSYNDTDPNTEYHIALAWDGSSCTMIIADSSDNTIASNTTTSDPYNNITLTPIYFGSDTYHASLGKYSYIDDLQLSDIVPTSSSTPLITEIVGAGDFGSSYLRTVIPEYATTTASTTIDVEVRYFMDSGYLSTSDFPNVLSLVCPFGVSFTYDNCDYTSWTISSMDSLETSTTTMSITRGSGTYTTLLTYWNGETSTTTAQTSDIYEFSQFNVLESTPGVDLGSYMGDISSYIPGAPDWARKFPLSYFYDTYIVFGELFPADGTGSSSAIIIPMGTFWSSTGNITLMSRAKLESYSITSYIHGLMIALLWLSFVYYVWRRSISIFNRDTN